MAGGLGDVQEISKHYDNMKYILAWTDMLSKPDWAIGLEGKRGSEITRVFKAVSHMGCKPQKLQTLKHFKPAFKMLEKQYSVHNCVICNVNSHTQQSDAPILPFLHGQDPSSLLLRAKHLTI